uniref:NADH-ubiquinone oxidoreductase chain 3 n=1 Tax=Oreohelix idahoensis TaxID=2584915 RepID=A0A4Y5P336_9EUPU|nr:NADH dehydrogenase subunit 3 [Oreohelix idahoensis]QCW57654.1 NADH dehydrogenase subunit 3 [Oreohelix idahoensis]UKG20816.1 NADH dehydrogenase subunit 3 [Oreohelix idahoensis]
MMPHMLMSLIIPIFLLFIYLLTFYINENNSMTTEKLTPFECGFEPMSKMRMPFSIRFFILVLLFLIFDVEIALLFPFLSKMMMMQSLSLHLLFISFLSILLIGLLFEWNKGALEWQE